MRNDFPHYSTIFSTQLTHTEINLLANLTGWMVRNSQSQFEELFASQVEVVEIKTPSEYVMPASFPQPVAAAKLTDKN